MYSENRKVTFAWTAQRMRHFFISDIQTVMGHVGWKTSSMALFRLERGGGLVIYDAICWGFFPSFPSHILNDY